MATSLTVVAAPVESTTTDTIPSTSLLNDRFIFEFGGYYSRSSTQASLSGTGGGAGVAVDFESAFGLNERNMSEIGGFVWRMNERWRLDIEYFELNRSASKTLETQVEWGGQTFPIGTTVDAIL